MKKRNFLATFTAVAVAASMFSAAAMTADAANTYIPTAGGTTSFDKYLVMDENANVPNVSFEYTVTAGKAQTFSANDKTIAVYAGPSPEKIAFSGEDISDETTADSKFEIAFAQGDTTVTQAAKTTDETNTDNVKNLDAGEKYAKKTAKLDFSEVKFDEPGIYRYIITETQGDAQGITYDADATRILDVYVVNDTENENALTVSSYVLHATDGTITIDGETYGSDGNVISTTNDEDDKTDAKSQGFTNEYTSHDLTFSKTVAGNQGSKDKYFAFTVTIENAVKGTVYDVSYADDNNANTTDGNADSSIKANPNSATTVITAAVTQPAILTVGEDGTVTQTFYLQHNQKIAIRGLADGTKYTITDGKEDYAAAYTTNDDKDTTAVKADVASNITGIAQEVTVDFTNTREGIIPTGILLSVAAPVVIGVVVLAGIVFLVVRNKKRDAEED